MTHWVSHTHAVAGTLGAFLSGFFAKPALLRLTYESDNYGPGLFYSLESRKLIDGLRQIGYQLAGVVFITVWNAVMTSIICIFISRIVNLRMDEDALEIGDDAAHGEEAFALWGDGEKTYTSLRLHISPRLPSLCRGQV